uniref:Uncharacterized protein n=1 Tax=viral metagenome TaxID=1070528 RepID=A0A6C0HZM5_9ZZZZ
MYIISGASFHIIAISFFVYIFVNLFENMIHYNIGRFSNKETKLELPSKKDFIKIAVVMCIFALIQGLLTNFFSKYVKT